VGRSFANAFFPRLCWRKIDFDAEEIGKAVLKMDPVQQRELARGVEFGNQIDILYFPDGRSAGIGAMQE
jgi:hypothetical protein